MSSLWTMAVTLGSVFLVTNTKDQQNISCSLYVTSVARYTYCIPVNAHSDPQGWPDYYPVLQVGTLRRHANSVAFPGHHS